MLDSKLDTKPDRGVRRRCSHCGSPFYDLLRSPIVCPKCGSKYTPVIASRRARPTPTGTDPEPVVAAARDAEDSEEKDELDDEDKTDSDDEEKDADATEDADAAPDGDDDAGKPPLD